MDWKNEKTLSSQGKVREFWTDWKWGIFTQNTKKNDEILAIFYFQFFSNFLIEVCLLNRFLCMLNSLNENTGKVRGKSWKFGRAKNVGTTKMYISNNMNKFNIFTYAVHYDTCILFCFTFSCPCC